MTVNRPRIGILASTNATILPAIVGALADEVDFAILVTDKEHCGARQKAALLGIPEIFLATAGQSREEWDKKCVQLLCDSQVDLVILVGFMRILSPVFVNAFPGKILNVHPSLLPKYAGGMNLDVHRAVIEAGEKETGATIHIVTEALDAGPIVAQQAVAVNADDTPDSLKAKVQVVEGELYPKAIRKLVDG